MRRFSLALFFVLMGSTAYPRDWSVGEVRRLTQGTSPTVMVMVSQAAVERSLKTGWAKLNHEKWSYPPASDRVLLPSGTRVGLLSTVSMKYGDDDVSFCRVRVQEGTHMGLVCYALEPSATDDLFSEGQPVRIANTKRAFGAFDKSTLEEFIHAQSVGDSALCRGYLALERVIPLTLGTRLVVDAEEGVGRPFVRVRVASGAKRDKTLYVERGYIQASYSKRRYLST